MYKYQYIFFILVFFITMACCTLWDFAVTTESKIVFFDANWNEITTAGHQFTHLSALSLDEAEDVVYFSDQQYLNGSIFSMRLLTNNGNLAHSISHEDIIENVIQRTQNETIAAIAYDPLKRQIYWTDLTQQKIFYANISADDHEAPKVLLDLSAEGARPDGLALDMCRRKLYWTNSNFKKATIESIDLETMNRKVIISDDLYLPHGIVVDQLSDRIYWVVDQQGHYFSVDSANLDGSDKKNLLTNINNIPLNIAVTSDYIYWTDKQENAIWRYEKVTRDSDFPNVKDPKINVIKVISFNEQPYGVVAHSRYLTSLQEDEHCKQFLAKVKKRLQQITPYDGYLVEVRGSIKSGNYCLNGGEGYLAESNLQRRKCICKIGWEGERCETAVCHNYCLQGGSCSMSKTGKAKCKCSPGYHGSRCEFHECNDYCLNDGVCRLTENNEAECECWGNFGGPRCEYNSTEICSLYCRVLRYEPETDVPYGCHDICSVWVDDDLALPNYKHLEICKNTDTISNGSVILIFTTGIVLCFLLVLLTVLALRRIYKPARPRIKKTFVVRKEATRNCPDTPLMNRPQIRTEQCEITIENCCNMNICETPCFDPKLMHESLSSCEAHLKDDRKMLIRNMEDELY